MINGRIIRLEEMAIDALNYIDGERDYFEWKHGKTHGLKGGLGKKNILIDVVIQTYMPIKVLWLLLFIFLLLFLN